MAERTIIRGVRLGDKTYVPGQEADLNAALSPEEARRLGDKGYLEGKWTGAAIAEEASDKPSPKSAVKEK